MFQLDLREFRYGQEPLLGELSLSLRAGETVAITGPSGIGKSTLLRIIAGLETRFSGDLKAPEQLAFVFQEPTLLRWRTVLQNICIPTGADERDAEALLEEVGLGGTGARFPGSLSLGQQRRLSLARAFAANPELLLMDEPFVSLDPELADEMMSLFARLRSERGTTTLLVTHIQAEADRLADRILRLQGSPATLVDPLQNSGA
ncbi:MAG: ABC transporter ATP-binding protein [Rhodobacteraceae bacterium]|nr:ABC transporter ATP-binding protein [Paracoccaceae bacterium]